MRSHVDLRGAAAPNLKSISYPEGPRTQIVGLIWALKPCYLGPWTLRARRRVRD